MTPPQHNVQIVLFQGVQLIYVMIAAFVWCVVSVPCHSGQYV